MNISEQIRLFIEPKSVAIIGASRNIGQGSLNMVENLLTFGYAGKIFPVNPKAREILGIKTYPRTKDIPGPVDLAVIITPRAQTLGAVRDCVGKEIKALIIIGQGFADGDEEGKRMQAEMVNMARERGARIIGPNTLGIVNYFNHFNASLAEFPKGDGTPVAIISQTGVFCLSYPKFGSLGKVFDIGNASDISFTDILEYLEDDPDTKIIFIYTEGINEGRRFIEVARRVTRKKPILAMKAGRSEVGKKAVASHTGALTGEDNIYETAFKQGGVIRVKNIEEFHDLSKALLNLPPMRGPKVGIVTTSGAGGIMASDACEDMDLEVASLSEKTKGKLERVYPPWMSVENPCDIWPAASIMRHGLANVYKMILEALVEDENIDGIACLCIAVNYGWGHFNIPTIIRDVAKVSPKPIVAWFFGPDMEKEAVKVEENKKTVAFPSVERGIKALAVLRRRHAITQEKPAKIELVTIAHEKIKDTMSRVKKDKRIIVGGEALEIVKDCGIAVPNYGVAHSKTEAVTVAEKIGYPVVMKIISPDIVHKTDVGGVIVGIKNRAEVESAYSQMTIIMEKYAKKGKVPEVLIQEMVQNSKEVILGMKRDNQFGPVLMFGMGGIYTEVFKDVSFRIAPINRDDALNMISEAKSYELLKGVRGKTPSDIGAIVDALSGLSQLALDFPEIEEIDLNPFMVLEAGRGGMGVDARISLSRPEH
ncbi:MAG: acetate--CoA ligase family protein [Pseudomonadota bacterium]